FSRCSTSAWISTPCASSRRCRASTVAMISPSLVEASRQMTSPKRERRRSLSRRPISSSGSGMGSPPAAGVVSAQAASPILGIVEAARQQLAGARCLDDVGGAITPHLRPLGIKRDKEMQPLTGVGVGRGEQCGIGNVKVRLIKRQLYGVLREGLLESVALGRAPVLGVDRLVLPQQRIDQVEPEQLRTIDDDAVGVPAQRAAERGEGERFRRRELEAGLDQMAARALLEIVPAFEDLARPRSEHGLAPPVKLD